MDTWMRFMSSDGGVVFGRVEGGYLHEYESLDQPVPTGAVLSTRALTPLAPCAPGKIVALWNNYHALAAKLGKPVPTHPLFLLKPAGSVIGADEPIQRPLSYAGRIVYEGELGIVIGRRCRDASVEGPGRYRLQRGAALVLVNLSAEPWPVEVDDREVWLETKDAGALAAGGLVLPPDSAVVAGPR